MGIPTAADTVGRSLGRKTEQVIAGARDVFMASGFEGASVDDIAKAAQVSKATLYAYFPDKSVLFARVIKEECARQGKRLEALVISEQPVREVLTNLATQYLTFLLSPFAQEVFRVCVGEARRFPELAREFYDSGPGQAHQFLADYLRQATERGELAVEDAPLAADQFTELCRSGVFYRHVFGVERQTDPDQVSHIAGQAVETFLSRYGA